MRVAKPSQLNSEGGEGEVREEALLSLTMKTKGLSGVLINNDKSLHIVKKSQVSNVILEH